MKGENYSTSPPPAPPPRPAIEAHHLVRSGFWGPQASWTPCLVSEQEWSQHLPQSSCPGSEGRRVSEKWPQPGREAWRTQPNRLSLFREGPSQRAAFISSGVLPVYDKGGGVRKLVDIVLFLMFHALVGEPVLWKAPVQEPCPLRPAGSLGDWPLRSPARSWCW